MSASSATSDETRRVMTTVPMDNVVTTLLQHGGHNTLMSLIPGLNKLNWQSNVGHVLGAVLQALGLRRSKDGKEIWTDAAPEKLTYQETKSVNSRPREQRHPAIKASTQGFYSTSSSTRASDLGDLRDSPNPHPRLHPHPNPSPGPNPNPNPNSTPNPNPNSTPNPGAADALDQAQGLANVAPPLLDVVKMNRTDKKHRKNIKDRK